METKCFSGNKTRANPEAGLKISARGGGTFRCSGGCAKLSVNVYRVELIDGPEIVQVYVQTLSVPIPSMMLEVTMELTKLTACQVCSSEQRLMHRTFLSMIF